MKHLRVSLVIMTLVSTLLLEAQETKNILWSFNFGYKGMNPTLNENWPIRQDVGRYYEYGSSSSVNVTSSFNYFGVSPEFILPNKKFSISSGLRYMTLNSEAVKRDYDRGGFFFLRMKSNELVTDYARVQAIREEISYLGVPLEFKYTPFSFVNIAFYVKLSGELAYQLNAETNIEFKQKEMEAYHDEVLHDLAIDVNPLYGSIYASVGTRIRLSDKLFVSMDMFFPSFKMTTGNSSLVDMNSVSGVQFSIDFPL